MSIKNQRPLFIAAALIIGVTAVSLVGLNLIVDHISKMSSPSLAVSETRQPPEPLSADDAQMPRKVPTMAPPENGYPPPPTRAPDPREQKQPDDAMRRVRNGKDAPDIRRTQPSPQQAQPPTVKDDALQNGQRGMPQYGYPPIPTDPKERERFEKMMEQYGPPPGYFPPQNGYGAPSGYPQQGYPQDNGYDYEYPYDYPEEYYDGYDQEYDLDSKLDQKNADDERTAEANDYERTVDNAHLENPLDDDEEFDDEIEE